MEARFQFQDELIGCGRKEDMMMQLNRRIAFLVMIVCAVLGSRTSARANENPLFGYTHMLSSPHTLPSGRVMMGTTVGLGITDFIELDTNLVLDIYQIYNGKLRVSVLDFKDFAAGFYLGYQYVNLNNLSASNPNVQISSWMPGAVAGTALFSNLAWFVGGNLFYSNIDLSQSNFSSSGLVQGAQVQSDLSWAYMGDSKKLGNVLSAGVTYNTTFKFYGIGATHHWRHFSLGLHYYPNASQLKVLPIISGGAVIDL